VNLWKGGDYRATKDELREIIPGVSLGLEANVAILHLGGEISLDIPLFDHWIGTVGLVPQLSVGIHGSWVFEFPYSLNPDGWNEIEGLPSYEEKDIPRHWNNDSLVCGC